MASPYRKQQRHHFWKSIDHGDRASVLETLYTRKFDINFSAEPKIATAGSCFAQHIRRELIARNLNYFDLEPAPELLPPEQRSRYGFEIFSARFGNIYTVEQLAQLAERATGTFTPVEHYWATKGRFYDPFRPTIEPDGFISLEELEYSRSSHLRSVTALLSETDVFIFTLGLTEAWRSQKDRAVFAMCPGTAAGNFDPALHEFHNYSVAEIVSGFERFMDIAHAYNPNMKFILTVSPVPLVATATKDHVINATSRSKAILRAAAGELYDAYACIDYFPSYEIFTSPAFTNDLYEFDRRSPQACGVALAMETFFKAHMPAGENTHHHESKLTEGEKSIRSFVEKQMDICDELLLEAELND